ncbi:MAG: lactoylglutathione lyase family protein [Promethearchaeota archaeon CR_4]|nr:MAG: lactoylglutathione lyase family protein [Candidatus Lokiarchaeota archaeon CR_4]
MMEGKNTVFERVDCIRIYVPDLESGLDYYHNKLGMKIAWKSKTAIGLLMHDKNTEIVIQNEHKRQETDIKVKSVLQICEIIKISCGKIKSEPFDIEIGKCAIVEDP